MRQSRKISARVLFVFTGLFTLPAWAAAGDCTLSAYTELGTKSTAQDYDEEDADDDYTYRNYHLKFAQAVSSRLRYDISSFLYDKDYSEEDSLDNLTRLYKTNWSYYLTQRTEESPRLDFRLISKQKRYDSAPDNDYNQVRLTPALVFSKHDAYTIDVTAGVNNYDYLEANRKDQRSIFGKISLDRYFWEKKLMATATYRTEKLDYTKTGRMRTKHEAVAGLDYIFNLPWLYKITNRTGWGQRDTKDDDEQDRDYDYKYWHYYTKTEHKIGEQLKVNLKYQYFTKDDISAAWDHRGFYVRNGWDYEIFDDEKQRLSIALDAQHKQVDYTLSHDFSYQKETVALEAGYRRKKDWKASVALEENIYGYSDETSDKKRYCALLSGEKSFFNGDLIASLDFTYRYTDYAFFDDTQHQALKVSFEHTF